MLKLLLAAHLVLAVFAVGPLVHAATTAGRGVRRGDGGATASSARVLRIYAYVSVLVIIAGFGLMAQKVSHSGASFIQKPPRRALAEFGDTWIWLSLALWVVAVGLVLGLIVPTLENATKRIAAQESVVALTGRIAAAGGVVALIFVVIVVLMVYRPGG